MSREKSAGAIIFRKEEDNIHYLLLHYPSGSRASKDYWDFPKGHIEKEEKEIETAGREVEEETGLKELEFISGFKEQIEYFFKLKGETVFKTVVFFLAETKTKEIKISFEHIGYQWLPYKEAQEQLTFDNAKTILKKANEIVIKFFRREILDLRGETRKARRKV